MGAVASILVYATFAVFALTCLGTVLMAFTLRRRFPDLWVQFGEPTEWLYLLRTSRDRNVLDFLEHRHYRQTGDVGFIRLCETIRVGWYAFLPLFVLALVCLGIVLLSKQ